MALGTITVILALVATALSFPQRGLVEQSKTFFEYVSREDWGANPPRSVSEINFPVPFVIIHHTYDPPACSTRDVCKTYMRLMQFVHQEINGFMDIGYNFAVGGDGAVYEARGWNKVGAHTVSYNVRSVGIALIGDYVSELPPAHQLETVKSLIATGVELGYISPDYALIGHRQAGITECPGEALFQEISTWENFQSQL